MLKMKEIFKKWRLAGLLLKQEELLSYLHPAKGNCSSFGGFPDRPTNRQTDRPAAPGTEPVANCRRPYNGQHATKEATLFVESRFHQETLTE